MTRYARAAAELAESGLVVAILSLLGTVALMLGAAVAVTSLLRWMGVY